MNALLPYVAQTMEGETRKLKALGLKPPSDSKKEEDVKVQPSLKEEVKEEEATKKIKKVTYYISLTL